MKENHERIKNALRKFKKKIRNTKSCGVRLAVIFLFVSVYARLTQQAPAAVRTVRNIRTRCTARALAPDSDERHVARRDTWVKEGHQLRVVSRLLQIVSDCRIEGGMNRCMKGRMAWGWHGDGIGWGGGGMQLAPYVLPPA